MSTAASGSDELKRPRLLFLSQVLPFPPDGGVKIRTYHTLRLLAREFDITALCFYRWKEGRLQQDVEEGVEALKAFGRVMAFPIPQEHSTKRLAWDHLRSVARRRVYTAYVYDSAPFARELSALLSDREFDLVHADSLDLSGYFKVVQPLPLVCAHHDAQSVLLRRRSERERSLWKAAYLAHQARLMAREEGEWCPRVDLNITVSEKDQEELKRVADGGEFKVVPNGVDVEFFQPSDEAPSSRDVVFVGGTTWFPNLDALEYFRESILPDLRSRVPSVKATWVGRASAQERRSYSAVPGLDLTGYVEDIRPFVHRAGCYVVPLRVGGGTRLKILDAWAMGKAVVSTSVGCEGLDARDGENILIRDDPSSLAAAVAEVLETPDLRDRLGQAARRTAESFYSWEVIGGGMIDRYRRLLTNP